MQITVSGRNVELTDALRDHIEEKVGKLQRYFDFPLRPQVVLTVQKDTQRVEITIPLGGRMLRAETNTGSMYASVDQSVDKIDRQIRKYKTRINRKARQVEDPLVFQQNPDPAPEEEEPRVVRTKRFTMKPMDVEEAILEMNMLDHDFFMFTNSETEQVNVVYRRRDGNYGLIEPEA